MLLAPFNLGSKGGGDNDKVFKTKGREQKVSFFQSSPQTLNFFTPFFTNALAFALHALLKNIHVPRSKNKGF